MSIVVYVTNPDVSLKKTLIYERKYEVQVVRRAFPHRPIHVMIAHNKMEREEVEDVASHYGIPADHMHVLESTLPSDVDIYVETDLTPPRYKGAARLCIGITHGTSSALHLSKLFHNKPSKEQLEHARTLLNESKGTRRARRQAQRIVSGKAANGTALEFDAIAVPGPSTADMVRELGDSTTPLLMGGARREWARTGASAARAIRASMPEGMKAACYAMIHKPRRDPKWNGYIEEWLETHTDWSLIVSPHPHIVTEERGSLTWLETLRARDDSRVRVVLDAERQERNVSTFDLAAECDVMLGEGSSTVMFSIEEGKPLPVILDYPARKDSSIVWPAFEDCPIVDTPEELAAAVADPEICTAEICDKHVARRNVTHTTDTDMFIEQLRAFVEDRLDTK